MMLRHAVSAKRISDLYKHRARIICLGTIIYESLHPVYFVEGLTEDGIAELSSYGLTVHPESRFYSDE